MTEKVSPRVVWSIVATAILGFVGILTETSMNVTFPDLIKQFGVPMGTVQWLTTAYLLIVALMMTTSAYLKAVMSPRKIFIWGMISFVIGDIISIFDHYLITATAQRHLNGNSGVFVILDIRRSIQTDPDT